MEWVVDMEAVWEAMEWEVGMEWGWEAWGWEEWVWEWEACMEEV